MTRMAIFYRGVPRLLRMPEGVSSALMVETHWTKYFTVKRSTDGLPGGATVTGESAALRAQEFPAVSSTRFLPTANSLT